MAVVPIVITKNNNKDIPEVLTTKCEYIKEITPEVKEIAQNLLDTVRHPKSNAAGLSAPQIGVSKRICVVRKYRTVGDDEEDELVADMVLINPEVTSASPATNVRWEGCLSIPTLFGMVERPKRVKVKAIGLDGKPIKIKAEGFFARVLQHEIDHLDGILYTSKTIGKPITETELDKLIEQEHKGI